MRVARYVSALIAAAALSAVPAGAEKLSDYQLDKLNGWAEAIAVCDVTRFLLTDPDIGADAILVAGRDNTFTTLYKPLYMPPNAFFSEVMHEAFDKVEKAGQVTSDAYGRARIHYAGPMLSAWRSATLAEKRALADQMDLCYHLAARTGVKLEMKH
jgi:hypothetical protein